MNYNYKEIWFLKLFLYKKGMFFEKKIYGSILLLFCELVWLFSKFYCVCLGVGVVVGVWDLVVSEIKVIIEFILVIFLYFKVFEE